MSKLTMQIGLGTSLILFFLGIGYLLILADTISMDSLVTMEPTSYAALSAGIVYTKVNNLCPKHQSKVSSLCVSIDVNGENPPIRKLGT